MQRRMRLQRRTEASVQSARQSRGLLHTGCSLQGAHTDTDTQTHRHTQTHTQTHTDTQTHTLTLTLSIVQLFCWSAQRDLSGFIPCLFASLFVSRWLTFQASTIKAKTTRLKSADARHPC